MCVVPLFSKENGFVMKFNICSRMYEDEPPYFSHVIMTHWNCKNVSFAQDRMVFHPILQTIFFNILHPTRTQQLAFMCILDRFTCLPYNSKKLMWCFEPWACIRQPFSIVMISIRRNTISSRRVYRFQNIPFFHRDLKYHAFSVIPMDKIAIHLVYSLLQPFSWFQEHANTLWYLNKSQPWWTNYFSIYEALVFNISKGYFPMEMLIGCAFLLRLNLQKWNITS